MKNGINNPQEGGELTGLRKSGTLVGQKRILWKNEIGGNALDSAAVEFLATVAEGEGNLDRGNGILQEHVEKRFAIWVKNWRSKSSHS